MRAKFNFGVLLILVFLSTSFWSFSQVNLPEMVLVEGGKFQMGSENGEDDEKPLLERTVNSFYISKYEITVGQYKAFCNATGWLMPETEPVWGWREDYPMVFISWKDAGAYALWLSRETGKNYRLPSEAEWEFAARGGIKSQNYSYSGSNNVDDVAWYYETTYGSGPQPVGLRKPNELGIFDMSGNVWEWCKDGYQSKYTLTVIEPSASVGMMGENYRVLRGGGWDSGAPHIRIANRNRNVPASLTDNTGFRVVYSVEK